MKLRKYDWFLIVFFMIVAFSAIGISTGMDGWIGRMGQEKGEPILWTLVGVFIFGLAGAGILLFVPRFQKEDRRDEVEGTVNENLQRVAKRDDSKIVCL
jgi:hypothetical protein